MRIDRGGDHARGRRNPRAFTLILILLPWVILAGIEGILRVSGVARPPSFYVHREVAGRSWLQINPSLGERFFPPSLRGVIPSPSFQIVSVEKRAGTKRVLCIGESTTAGFPFPVTGGFPALLQQILQEQDPATGWDVINCGLTGISSTTVASMIDEILEARPDYLVVYLGHNEFYGVGGVGSRDLGIRNLRIARLMERLLSRGAQEKQPGTLMERLAARASIPPKSSLRATAYRRYAKQIDRILDAADRTGTKVVLCEVVSNERDLYPLGTSGPTAVKSVFEPGRWKADRPGAEAASQIVARISQSLAADSLNAGLHYLRGAALLVTGDVRAADDFARSRDLDAVPFRAPDPINAVLRDAAARRHVAIVPTERIFRSVAPGGSPGEESFVEHLHPTWMGNARIAAAVAAEITGQARGNVTPEEAARWLKGSAITRLDLAFADARVTQLLRRWPYERGGEDSPPFPYHARSVREEASNILRAAGDSVGAAYMHARDPEEESLVEALLAKRTDLLKAHTRLARDRASHGSLIAAAREYAAATSLYPVDAGLWLEYGETLLRIGDRPGAGAAAQRALFWSPADRRAADLLQRASTQ
jgi:hypothetical protein